MRGLQQTYTKLTTVTQCTWCHRVSHITCTSKTLGCKSCCDNIIPGYRYTNRELIHPDHYYSVGNFGFFNPFDHDKITNYLGSEQEILDEIQEHSEISNKLMNCKYKQLKNVPRLKNKNLRILSLNIRSLPKNMQFLRENITHIKFFDLLCFNESNCDTDTLPNGIDDLLIEGFHPPITKAPFRSSNKGGGLAIYVNCSTCNEHDIELLDINCGVNDNHGFEYMFVKLNIGPSSSRNNQKSFIIGNFYRSPSLKPKLFLEDFQNILNQLNRHKNKHIVLLGDLNIDLIKHDTDSNSQNLIDITTSHGFLQIISRPTRITDHSAKLIDHIYTNQIHSITSSGIITLDISDHLATYTNIALDDNVHHFTHNENSAEYRSVNAANLANFRENINNEAWDNVAQETSTQIKYDKFIDMYSTNYNNSFPTKSNSSNNTRRKNQRKNPKAWILPWLENACNRKNKLYHTYIKDPCIKNKIKYQNMKKFVNKHTTKAKNKYYHNYFEEYRTNSRKQWQMLNSLLNRNTKRSKTLILNDHFGNVIRSPMAVAEHFNDYFSNIATNLKNEINATDINFDEFLKNPTTNSIYLKPTDPDEVNTIIQSLKNKSTADTCICALKTASEIPAFNIAMADIINRSFEEGVFPSQLKLAKVIPIHKNGPKTDVSNYRPISLLSSFSKIFEKMMHNRITSFLESNNSLHELQYGFRAGRSCEHALLAAQHEILTCLSKKQIAMLLLIDFSKAFDMVNHEILLKKLVHYGIRGLAHTWLASYLSNREQYVSINGKHSSSKMLECGVPQGSILGPLLFIIYINDIPHLSHLAKFILYADDANIIITGNNLDEIEAKFTALSTALMAWVSSNELALNVRKTNYMIFTNKRKIDFTNFAPKLGNIPIERKNVARFLGVLIDEKLTWKHHITAIKTKMSRYIGILYKLKHILPLSARINVFHSLVQSHLNYCSLVWGLSCKSNIETLFVTQKKAMRAIMPGYTNYFYRDGIPPSHTKPAFTSLNILTVHNVYLKIYLFL